MHNLKWLRTIARIIIVGWIFLLFVLAGFQAVPVFAGSDAQYINQANLQGVRSQLLAKAVLILEYQPISGRTQTISDLQVTYPLFQQEQAILLTNNQPDVQLALQATRPSYLAMVAAIKTILAHVNQTIDPTQVDIISVNNRLYLSAMINVTTTLQQNADARTFQLFSIELIIEALLLICLLLLLFMNRKILTRISEKNN